MSIGFTVSHLSLSSFPINLPLYQRRNSWSAQANHYPFIPTMARPFGNLSYKHGRLCRHSHSWFCGRRLWLGKQSGVSMNSQMNWIQLNWTYAQDTCYSYQFSLSSSGIGEYTLPTCNFAFSLISRINRPIYNGYMKVHTYSRPDTDFATDSLNEHRSNRYTIVR
jgi:hypothetical protein